VLEHKDVAHKIQLHLQQVGKYAHDNDVVQFLSHPETCAQLIIPHPLGLHTAQWWMSQYGGFCQQAEPKGQYFDGHKQDDMLKYCQLIYLRTIYNNEGIPDPQCKLSLCPGKKPITIWFHDKSVFFGNNQWLVQWAKVGKHAKLFKNIQLWWLILSVLSLGGYKEQTGD
ncbi:hypothetical protein B0J17DRAFT_566854, partial [Rhizoctonia solani]